MIIDHVATVRLALCGVIVSAHGKSSRFRGSSQKIMAASQRHFGECRFFSWPRFARGQVASCALLREPPTLRLPIRAWAAGLSFLEEWKSDVTSAVANLSVRCSTLEPGRPNR